ncbi:universal stress protein [Gordonia sp. p3-SID1431]|uniref:universal stress protein n=1 Tax=Gordonia sp. p3-SID1431 TaxID=2916159 RepID=UPI0021A4B227|nr:universal stress protein [Gordonia sp. p3-SID1431]MCT1352935.1 universal stress protein [Gordonia sp. p3-SID1431]
MNTIAVGVDLSPESEAAAHWAAASARDGDRLLLIHGFAAAVALQPLSEFELDFDVTATRQAAAAHLTALAGRLGTRRPGLRIETVVEHDFAIPLLTRLSGQVDLMVLGHHRPGLIERLTTGSISSALSARSRCPVVTVPYGNLATGGPVVAAIDADAPSDLALSTAFEYADATGNPVAIVCAIPDDAPPARIEALYARADALLDPWRRRFPDRDTTLQLVNGNPSRAVGEAVPQASLLVVTRPRAGSTFATWAGSVARAAQHHTRCPIAIVDHSRSGHLDRGSTS